jgi:hypothetical protein
MFRSSISAAVLSALIVGATGCDGDKKSDSQEVGAATNLWWDEDWEQNGDPAPIEVLSQNPMKVRVRFLSDGEAGPVELALMVVPATSGGGGAADEVEEYSLGEFLLDDPVVGPGENVYEIEPVVPPALADLANAECRLVGILDPSDKIPETIEIPESEPTDPADPKSRGDNSLSVPIDLSGMFKLTFAIEDLKFDPGVLVLNAQEIPTITKGYTRAVYFGEDLNGNVAARLQTTPRADAARAAFFAATIDPRVEDFDTGFTDGQLIGGTKAPLRFESRGAQEVPAIDGQISTASPYAHVRKATGTFADGYPTSGSFYLEAAYPQGLSSRQSLITIDLPADKPQRALGFNVTGLGNTGTSKMLVGLGKKSDGETYRFLEVPLPSIDDPLKRIGAVFFFGVVLSEDPSHFFDRIEVAFEGGLNAETYGIDDVTIASDALFSPFGGCVPGVGTRLAANTVISFSGWETIGADTVRAFPAEVDFSIEGHEEITDALRAEGELPVSTILADQVAIDEAIEIMREGGEPERIYEHVNRKDLHVELCPPSALLQAAAGLLLDRTDGATSLDLAVAITVRTRFDSFGIEVENTERTARVTIRILDPPALKGVDWEYPKSFGNETIGGAVYLGTGIYTYEKGIAGCAAGELDLTLFGTRLDNIVDACAQASSDIPDDSAALALQVRNLTLGFEDGKVVQRHHVIYEKRSTIEFVDEGTPPTMDFDPEFTLTAGSAALYLGDDAVGGKVLAHKSWGKCWTWVVYCIPVGLDLEIGGRVGLRVDFKATKKDDGGRELSLLAGPFFEFYGGASVFLGACADELVEDLDKQPSDVVQAAEEFLECGKVVGASIDLTFLNFLIGPKGTVVLTPKVQGEIDGFEVTANLDLTARITTLKGSISIWVHYLFPNYCWTEMLGTRLPYLCGPPFIKCRTAALRIVSFPGFSWDVHVKHLKGAEFWTPELSGGIPCIGCPRTDQ